MVYIEAGVINMYRGDDGGFVVPLPVGPHGRVYELGEDEYLIFGVRERPDESCEVLLEIRSEPGSNIIEISHEDTMNLEPGFYSAEIQLMAADGKRVTVWPMLRGNQRVSTENRKNFCLFPEVIRT